MTWFIFFAPSNASASIWNPDIHRKSYNFYQLRKSWSCGRYSSQPKGPQIFQYIFFFRFSQFPEFRSWYCKNVGSIWNWLRCRHSISKSKIFAFEIQMSKSLFSRNKQVNLNFNIFKHAPACLPSTETFIGGEAWESKNFGRFWVHIVNESPYSSYRERWLLSIWPVGFVKAFALSTIMFRRDFICGKWFPMGCVSLIWYLEINSQESILPYDVFTVVRC